MIHAALRVTSNTLILLALSGALSEVGAQLLFTKDLCGAGAGNIGNNWVSLPTDSDIATAEDFCAAIPAAVAVSQQRLSGPGVDTWSYDCTTATCTSSTGIIPEPGCLASSCFCVDDGEGFQIRPSVATRFEINGCDTFVPITVTTSFRGYLISVPYDTFLVTLNDLARYIGLPTTLPQGVITRLDCETGLFQNIPAGSAGGQALLVPGEAYRVTFPSTAGFGYLNPVSCRAPLPSVDACPIDNLSFTDSSNLAWGAPAGCPLPPLYDTARGDLSCLRNVCIQPVARVCPSCVTLENNDVDTTAADAASPPVGQGYWYLARVDGGTWNGSGTTQCVDFDNMVGAGCP